MRFMEAARTFPPGTKPKIRRRNWSLPEDRIELDDVSAINGGEWAVGPWATLIAWTPDDSLPDGGGEKSSKILASLADDGTDEWEPWTCL